MTTMSHQERMGRMVVKNRDIAHFLGVKNLQPVYPDEYKLSKRGSEQAQIYIDYKRKLVDVKYV